LDYGALTVQIAGDFDDAMERVKQVSSQLGIYLVNSVNPFRLEGQKTIMFRVLEGLNWPTARLDRGAGGESGELERLRQSLLRAEATWGLIDRIPRLAVINAAGANTPVRTGRAPRACIGTTARPTWSWAETYYRELEHGASPSLDNRQAPSRSNRPVNLKKCLAGPCRSADGVVREVTDQEILDAKAKVGAGGLGCEPASAASVAGAKKLVEEGVIQPGERVVCILTGHQLKDPTAHGRLPQHRPGEVSTKSWARAA